MYGEEEKNYDNRELMKDITIQNLIEIFKLNILDAKTRVKVQRILIAYAKLNADNALNDKTLFPDGNDYTRTLNR